MDGVDERAAGPRCGRGARSRARWCFGLVAVFASAVVLAAPSALALPEAEQRAAEPSEIRLEVGDGVPPGIPPKLLRESFAALRDSEPGHAYLSTPDGRRYAAEVRRALRGEAAADRELGDAPGASMCDDCGGVDYDTYNDAADTYGETGGADGWAYFATCKSPYVVAKHRNVIGHDLWHYYQQLNFCFEAGRITYVHRTRWAWLSTHWMNGWSFNGHMATNCDSETCHGQSVGATGGRYWTQGQFEVCNLWRFGCRARHPMIGIDLNAWGGWVGWVVK